MLNSKAFVRLSIILGVFTFFSLILSSLALVDIYHCVEPDLTLEWNMVRVSLVITLFFSVISIITILKIRIK